MNKNSILLSGVFFTVLMLNSCGTLESLIQQSPSLDSTQIQGDVKSFSVPKNEAKELIKKIVDRRFIFADKNKDRKLFFSEFKGLESEHDDVMKKSFDEYDKNKDSSVSYDEFLTLDTVNANNGIKSMFSMLDQSRNKFIDSGLELDMVVEIAQQEANDSGKKLTMEEVKEDFLSYDDNKDGKLNFDEFISPELKYILILPVDPYKNAINKSFNGISMNMLVNNTKIHLKK